MTRINYWIPFVLLLLAGVLMLSDRHMGVSGCSPLSKSLTVALNSKQPDVLIATLAAVPLPSGLKIEPAEAKGTSEKLKALQEKQADLALIRTGLGLDYRGVCAAVAAGRHLVHLIVPAGSAITTFRDLAGKRLGAGPAQGDAYLLAQQVISYLHFADEPALVTDYGPGSAEAFANEQIDALLLLEPLLSPVPDELLATGYYRLVPIPEAEAIARVLPGVESDMVPAHTYGPERAIPPAEEAPFPTLSVEAVVAARAEAPAAPMAAILSDLLAIKPATSMGLVRFALPPARGYEGLPLHPAAIAATEKDQPASAESLRQATRHLAGWILLLLAVWQGMLLWERHNERKRRKTLVEWFELVQDIGARMEVAEGPVELGRLVDDLASKQRLAERAFVTGKLEAQDLLLFTSAHQARVLDALSKYGSQEAPAATAPVSTPAAAPSFFSSYAGRSAAEEEEEMDRSPTIVRPDYGEALINTVRVRRREPGPAEAVSSESSSDRIARTEQAAAPPARATPAPSREEESGAASAMAETETEAASAGGIERTSGFRRRRRGGRGRGRGPRGEEPVSEPAPAPAPPEAPAKKPVDQMDLFGRRQENR